MSCAVGTKQRYLLGGLRRFSPRDEWNEKQDDYSFGRWENHQAASGEFWRGINFANR